MSFAFITTPQRRARRKSPKGRENLLTGADLIDQRAPQGNVIYRAVIERIDYDGRHGRVAMRYRSVDLKAACESV